MLMRYFFILFLINGIFWGCNSGNSGESSLDQKDPEDMGIEPEPPREGKGVILFFGNSLTAGYGLEPEEAFPALIQEKLIEDGYEYRVVNAGVSGETTTTGLSRLEWILEQHRVDIFVLELGANDGLRGIDPDVTRRNLKSMIDMVREANPDVDVILAGMMVPPSMGQDYSTQFARIFPEIAEEKDVKLIPFLLEGVAGDKELNQYDKIHPTAEGQKILARNVWNVLESIIREREGA
jgi:acyl-CoA thioesterase I